MAKDVLRGLPLAVSFETAGWAQPDVVAAIVSPEQQIRETELRACPRMRLAITTSTGTDNIDVGTCRARGVAVWHPRDYCSDEVADTTLALLLGLLRGTVALARSVSDGYWDFAAAGPLRTTDDVRLGLLGFGTIGRKVAIRASGLKMSVAVYDPYAPSHAVAAAGVRRSGLVDLFRNSTAISIHTPLTPETRGLVSRDLIQLLPHGSVLINVARGEIVDTDAVVARLEDGHLAGAALDVLPVEPPNPAHPVPQHPRLVVTPHAAWYSSRAADTLFRRPLEIVRDYFLGAPPEGLHALSRAAGTDWVDV